MLYDAHNRPIDGYVRRGMQVDAFSQGAGITSVALSQRLHNKLASDSTLREKIEKAQRMRNAMFPKRAGTIMHLDLLGQRKVSKQTEKAMFKNQAFGEEIMKKRSKDENLTEGGNSNEALKNVA